MFPSRQITAAATAMSLIAFTFFTAVVGARAEEKPGGCNDATGLAVLTSPVSPSRHAPLRVVFAMNDATTGELSLVGPDGTVAVSSTKRHGGPPYFWYADVAKPASGKWQARLTREGMEASCATITRKIVVHRARPAKLRAAKNSVWPIHNTWNRAQENLYSAWIEKLFDAPLDASPSWRALHDVLRDPTRNFLFNHLGLREDERKLYIRPDCADLPYFLRGYFAFKMGLPFGYSKCTRGGGGKAPRCYRWWNIKNEEPPPAPPAQKKAPGDLFGIFGNSASPQSARISRRPPGLVPGFGYYLRTTVADSVHSGAGRTLASDNKSDFYLVSLKHELPRPGTVYADPYGHLLVLAKRVAQTDEAAGILLAVDAQPDGTVARKRFWRGNFLFANDPALGSPGFKRFRPVVAGKKGSLRRLTNKEIANNPHYGDYSLDQSRLGIEDFYDRMDDLISPAPLDPMRAIKVAITALEEQVNARVNSVENGRKFQNKGGAKVAIPDGASIFETTGPWEDFATPARDLRLLIAMDVVRGFPDRVARRPERYDMPSGKSVADVKTELESKLSAELAARKFSYKRSDGSGWMLTLKEVMDRIELLEMAYNINDCVEHRWGAPTGSDEAATCKRRAPRAQVDKMTEYREWFKDRRRPPRG